MSGSYADRFQEYFARDVAENAAKSLSNGAEMEFRIESTSAAAEVFAFRRVSPPRRSLKLIGARWAAKVFHDQLVHHPVNCGCFLVSQENASTLGLRQSYHLPGMACNSSDPQELRGRGSTHRRDTESAEAQWTMDN